MGTHCLSTAGESARVQRDTTYYCAGAYSPVQRHGVAVARGKERDEAHERREQASEGHETRKQAAVLRYPAR